MYPVGYVLLYSPAKTVLWCIRHGYLPWPRVYLDLLMTLPILLVSFGTYTHALQSMGNGYFIHTRMGMVRYENEFPPGYLETAWALQPKRWSTDIENEFMAAVGRSNRDISVLPLTTVFRWAYYLGLISKDFRQSYHTVQCASLIAWTWKKSGIDLLADEEIPYVGIYPSDLAKLSEFN